MSFFFLFHPPFNTVSKGYPFSPFFLLLFSKIFLSNAPPLSDISSREHFSREGENEESKRERGFCVPDSICRIRSSPEFIPALKILRRPLDMNRATVDRFLFCHLFSLPLPFRSSLFRDFYFHRTHQTFRSHCAPIRSHDFSRARKITREGSCFSHDVKWNILAIIPLGKHAVPTLSRMGRIEHT